MNQTPRLLRRLFDTGGLELPRPAAGDTPRRFRELIEIARTFPVGVVRLAEAHTDACAILCELGHEPRPGSLYGVWASASPTGGPELAGDVLNGTKRFCSGLGIVDRALVTVTDRSGASILVDVDVVVADTIATDTSRWSTVALDDTATGDITFTNHTVDPDARIGSPGDYLDRPGFWHGALGPAAAWAGSVLGIIDVADAMTSDDPHQRAHVGAMTATRWSLTALFDAAGREIDDDPDSIDAAEVRARSIRHVTERSCADVMDRFDRAFGPRPLTTDPDLARRVADTHLYLRQHHGERELAALVDAARRVETS